MFFFLSQATCKMYLYTKKNDRKRASDFELKGMENIKKKIRKKNVRVYIKFRLQLSEMWWIVWKRCVRASMYTVTYVILLWVYDGKFCRRCFFFILDTAKCIVHQSICIQPQIDTMYYIFRPKSHLLKLIQQADQ